MHFLTVYTPLETKSLSRFPGGFYNSNRIFHSNPFFLHLHQLGLTTNISFWSGLIFSISSLLLESCHQSGAPFQTGMARNPWWLEPVSGWVFYFLMSRSQNHLQLALRGINGLVSGYTLLPPWYANSRPENLNYSMAIVRRLQVYHGAINWAVFLPTFGIRAVCFTSVCYLSQLFFHMPLILTKINLKAKTSFLDMSEAFQTQLVILLGVWLLIQAALQTVFPTLALLSAS